MKKCYFCRKPNLDRYIQEVEPKLFTCDECMNQYRERCDEQSKLLQNEVVKLKKVLDKLKYKNSKKLSDYLLYMFEFIYVENLNNAPKVIAYEIPVFIENANFKLSEEIVKKLDQDGLVTIHDGYILYGKKIKKYLENILHIKQV